MAENGKATGMTGLILKRQRRNDAPYQNNGAVGHLGSPQCRTSLKLTVIGRSFRARCAACTAGEAPAKTHRRSSAPGRRRGLKESNNQSAGNRPLVTATSEEKPDQDECEENCRRKRKPHRASGSITAAVPWATISLIVLPIRRNWSRIIKTALALGLRAAAQRPVLLRIKIKNSQFCQPVGKIWLASLSKAEFESAGLEPRQFK